MFKGKETKVALVGNAKKLFDSLKLEVQNELSEGKSRTDN